MTDRSLSPKYQFLWSEKGNINGRMDRFPFPSTMTSMQSPDRTVRPVSKTTVPKLRAPKKKKIPKANHIIWFDTINQNVRLTFRLCGWRWWPQRNRCVWTLLFYPLLLLLLLHVHFLKSHRAFREKSRTKWTDHGVNLEVFGLLTAWRPQLKLCSHRQRTCLESPCATPRTVAVCG